jgi:hypothetical protein
MLTKRFWGPVFDDRRARTRSSADFYAIELAAGARYLRRVANVSRDGLLLESPLGDEQPGQLVELELPRRERKTPVRVKAEVVRVTPEGKVGVKRLESSAPLPVDTLGGRESL